MRDMDKAYEVIQAVRDGLTMPSTVSERTGLTKQQISKIRNGEYKLENITFESGENLASFYDAMLINSNVADLDQDEKYKEVLENANIDLKNLADDVLELYYEDDPSDEWSDLDKIQFDVLKYIIGDALGNRDNIIRYMAYYAKLLREQKPLE